MLCAAGGCELSCENRLEEILGAAEFKAFIQPPLLQDSWLCVQLMFLQCNAPCIKRDSTLEKTGSTAFMAQ